MPGLERQLKGGFAGKIEATDFVSNADQAKSQRAGMIGVSGLEVTATAIDNQWLSHGAARLFDRHLDSDDPDPDYKTTDETLEALGNEFNLEDKKWLSESTSSAQYNNRINNLRDDIKRHRALASYGTKGAVAEIVAGVFDPAGWGLGLLSGGAGIGAKAGRIAQATKAGLIAGGEAAAFESVLAASDTQRGIEDIMFASGAGLLLGGSLGAAFRQGPKGNFAKAADDVDTAMHTEVNDILKRESRTEAQATDAPDVTPETITINETKVKLNTKQVDGTLEAHVEELRNFQGKPLKGREKAQLKQSAKDLRKSADPIKAEWKAHKARVAASFGAPRNVDEAGRNKFRFDSIANMYEPRIKAIEERALKIDAKIENADEAAAKSAELRQFQDMTRVEQIRQLFPDGAPKLSDEIEKQAKAAKAQTVNDVPEEPPETGGSVGAAQAEGAEFEEDYFTTGETMDEYVDNLIRDMDDIPQPITVKALSAFSVIDHSENLAFRGLAHKLLENPQGNAVPQDTAAILTDVYNKQMRGAVQNRYNEGFEEWNLSQGRGMVKSALDAGNHRAEFDEAVMLKIYNPKMETNEAITKAAEGVRAGFRKALELRKKNGEAGFDDVKFDDRYMPLTLDGHKVNTNSSKRNKRAVINTISKGYQTGGIPIKKKHADALAEMQYIRSMDGTMSSRKAFDNVVSQSEREDFIKELREAGIDDATIKEFTEGKELRELSEGISNRAKKSLFINPEAEVDGLRVIDLLNTNMSEMTDGYFKEAAGGAAMARHGFATREQAFQVIDAAEAFGRNLDQNPERLLEEANMLKATVNMMYGRSIEDAPGSKVVENLRRLRGFTAMVRLQQVAFAQIPETARAIVHLGLQNVLNSVPGTAFFRRKTARGGKSSGQLAEPELREIEELLGHAVGEDEWMISHNLHREEVGEGGFEGDKMRLFDNAMAAGARVTKIASGFQATQGGLEKMTMRSIKKRIIQMANGDMPWETGLTKEVGWTPEFLDEVSDFVKRNPKSEEFNGRDVKLLNIDAMTPEMREKLIVGMTRMSGRLIQRQFIGETGVWMNKSLGKTLTQFRTFSLVSAEKQLIHDLKGDKIAAAQILGWSTLLGYLSYASQVNLQAIGEEDPDAFLESRMNERALAFGVFNKLPQTAALGIGGDVFATLGLLPDDMYAAPGRFGYRPLTSGTVAPAAGLVGDLIGIQNSVVDLLTGDGSGKDVAKKARRLVPLGNTIGLGNILKAGINELD